MNSRRLKGVHRLTHRFLVQINTSDNRQMMPKFEADKDQILKRGAKLFFTFLERRSEGKHARAGRDTAREGIILELVVEGLPHGQFDVFAQDISFAHSQPLAALYKLTFVSGRWV
jgi:hypothetical protein